MANDASIEVDTVTIKDTSSSEIQDSTTIAETTETGKKVVEVQDNNFVLSSVGVYGGNSFTGGVPGWLATAISNGVANGTLTIEQAINDLDLYVKNMETGVNQNIVSLQNKDGVLNSLITTNKTEVDNSLAAIGTDLTTKVTSAEATAIANTVIASEFAGTGGTVARAFYDSNVSTLANDVSANTSSITAMATTITDPVTGVVATATNLTTGYATVGLNPDGTLSANANNSAYISAAIGPQQVSIDASDNITIDANGVYTASTSKLITDANGVVSGWTNSNLNGRSEFAIKADNFYIESSSSPTYRPFSVSGTDIVFNGKVSFTNTTGAPTSTEGTVNPTGTAIVGSTYHNTTDGSIWTYTSTGGWVVNGNPNALVAADLGPTGTTVIDGGLITTGKVQSVDGNTYFDLDNSKIVMSGGEINTGTINSSDIQGSTVTGSVIKGSWLDLTTTGVLTDWAFYTPATVPTAYVGNFAKDNVTGDLIVDANGFVRLPTISSLLINSVSSTFSNLDTTGGSGGNNSLIAANTLYSLVSVYSYDSYQVNTTSRVVRQVPVCSCPTTTVLGSISTVGRDHNMYVTVFTVFKYRYDFTTYYHDGSIFTATITETDLESGVVTTLTSKPWAPGTGSTGIINTSTFPMEIVAEPGAIYKHIAHPGTVSIPCTSVHRTISVQVGLSYITPFTVVSSILATVPSININNNL